MDRVAIDVHCRQHGAAARRVPVTTTELEEPYADTFCMLVMELCEVCILRATSKLCSHSSKPIALQQPQRLRVLAQAIQLADRLFGLRSLALAGALPQAGVEVAERALVAIDAAHPGVEVMARLATAAGVEPRTNGRKAVLQRPKGRRHLRWPLCVAVVFLRTIAAAAKLAPGASMRGI
eukprot:CAMPEP_0179094032 /NCGR_PEP_ID=MMETSP0796-20121207/43102_1 /TAXON_ID=73915 /ORGANISM="Pyrodinium bahamense, Strain pbaha01" /LENGTH=178 /DNA_ID=CAMNT_0020791693 /DNA_START=95 /DNA_END=634 /DNA_ORIENTATION=+